MPSSSSTSKTRNRSKTPSFVCEIPLRVDTAAERTLLARLEAARQLYNACLGEAMRRLRLVRASKWYQKAKHTPKDEKHREERREHFKAARHEHRFTDAALQQYAVRLRLKGEPVQREKGIAVGQQEKTWLGEHIEVHIAQKLASRAFDAASKMLLGKARRVRFKGRNQLDSIEGKSNETALRWRNNALVWGGLTLPGVVYEQDEVIAHGLQQKVKYVRLVRRKIHGRNRFYAQLVEEGLPYVKEKHRERPLDTVGLDIGPSTIAYVGKDQAELQVLAGGVKRQQKKIRWLQRHLDRQRRANNPDNFNSDGIVKRGVRLVWKKSTRQQQTEAQLAELHRREAAHRKSLIGQLSNEILRLGVNIQTEKVSYRGWQRLWGKSIGMRSPGMLMATLRRKAESAGGQVNEFSTRTTRLSQVCHCGRVHKKSLRERWHDCECGVSAQRDLYSAFLARYVQGDRLSAAEAERSWPGAESLLRTAFNRAKDQSASRSGFIPASFGLALGVRADRPQKVGQAELRSGMCRVMPVGDRLQDNSREPGKGEAVSH